jgi:hypothetical protein
MKTIARLSALAALLFGLAFALPAFAAQQTLTLAPPVYSTGMSCPTAPDILTTVTANANGTCTITAASGLTSAQGNAITNPYLSDNARQLIVGLHAQGWSNYFAPTTLTSAACTVEGQLVRWVNNTAACSAGATATFAGVVHCSGICNGTSIIQIGE